MITDKPNEILEKWRKLQDVDEERRLFGDYLRARDNYLLGMQRHVKGEISDTDLQNALLAEVSAFDTYVAHRSKSTYRN